ncbi:metallophosphoesterase family protein [Crateriforma conspicua]|uniref:PhoD-like phosphatase n=1 Tax=Crateriforma conspicua TaxID=2527996 RepID=A0A5C6FQC6_9PLAN|nr:metallophosphoesterase family protein [Crateriforma conspicua]TWU64611.1 PhoD-like phosphatase [Crateriforma conspicua]
MKQNLILTLLGIVFCMSPAFAQPSPFPGERGADLDSAAWENIWNTNREKFLHRFVKVPRDEVVGFALYTHDSGVLKMTAQLYPLRPEEPREVRLELKRDGKWQQVATAEVLYPGWSAHFRIESWDGSRSIPYRVRHGESAQFEGLIRADPIDKNEIVIGSFSCNSNRDREDRQRMVDNVKRQDPDLLFFAGDQSYDHTQHTAAWLLWGKQFADIIRDRPVVTIPDDHDIGQANLWGEGGIVGETTAGPEGGYYFPAEYVKMVERCQTWHLPDAVDPQPIAQGIGVYFTRLRVGGIDFAILEDRKFKTGPAGTIPQMGPRPDHIQEVGYDPARVDVAGLKLLGDRQLAFLNRWAADWTGAKMKAVLSQTAFCGAVHLHGSKDNRLLADLDCNGWPQTGRNRALEAIRRALACHVCGDQHLAVVVKHGIDGFRDGPFAFTSPAILNSVYGRWWWPEDEQPGPNPVAGSPLPWTGDYRDGLYNHITMHAYANPDLDDNQALIQNQRDPDAGMADGYGIVRFEKSTRRTTFECWPRYADVRDGDSAQYPGWPVTFSMMDNDGRDVFGHLPELIFEGFNDPVVQVINDADGEVLYTLRIQGNRFRPHVFSQGSYTVKAGKDLPQGWSQSGLLPDPKQTSELTVRLGDD